MTPVVIDQEAIGTGSMIVSSSNLDNILVLGILTDYNTEFIEFFDFVSEELIKLSWDILRYHYDPENEQNCVMVWLSEEHKKELGLLKRTQL